MLVAELVGMCEILGIQYGQGYETFNYDVFERIENKVKEIQQSLEDSEH